MTDDTDDPDKSQHDVEENARYRNPPRYRGIDPSPGIEEREEHNPFEDEAEES